MGLAVFGWKAAASAEGLSDVWILAIGVAIGVCLYVGMMVILRVPELGEARTMVRHAKQRLGYAVR